MEQYRGLYKYTEEVIKNLGEFKLFCYFFTWDWNAILAKNSHQICFYHCAMVGVL